MDTNNQYVIDTLLQWLEQGHDVWLATVIKTWGSSPRPVGSLLACAPGTGLAGSLSGGCIEEDLLEQFGNGSLAREYALGGHPLVRIFGGTEAEQQRLQLPCGGTLEIIVERLTPSQEVREHFHTLARAIRQRRAITRRVCMSSGQLSLSETISSDTPALDLQHNRFSHPFRPEWQMLLTGTGEVSRCVAELAAATGFTVTICDFRRAFLDNCSIENANIVEAFPDDLVRESFHDRHSAVITLAHDPRVDDMALMQALTTNAFYIGAMGSQRTSGKRLQRLEQLGLTAAQTGRLQAPAGYPTGSKTPWEIAISIMAQVIAARTASSAA